ncbi:MAG: hypothetical protein JXC32_10810, partial [Anaerolineae bacterium]|nr:hypothetical protein [Anaerolineae bacterium]
MNKGKDNASPASMPEGEHNRSRQWLRAIADITELMVISDVKEPDVLAAFEILRGVTGAERIAVQVTPHENPLDESQVMLRVIPFPPPTRVLPLSERWRRTLRTGSPVLCDTTSALAG